mmetsp:Transcript_44078/g.134193  ORF Transcript_44078/g.134193 Transcript_44078/m.134193 type:complete len:279 (+) Transcript_44078:1245-2081(+)
MRVGVEARPPLVVVLVLEETNDPQGRGEAPERDVRSRPDRSDHVDRRDEARVRDVAGVVRGRSDMEGVQHEGTSGQKGVAPVRYQRPHVDRIRVSSSDEEVREGRAVDGTQARQALHGGSPVLRGEERRREGGAASDSAGGRPECSRGRNDLRNPRERRRDRGVLEPSVARRLAGRGGGRHRRRRRKNRRRRSPRGGGGRAPRHSGEVPLHRRRPERVLLPSGPVRRGDARGHGCSGASPGRAARPRDGVEGEQHLDGGDEEHEAARVVVVVARLGRR